MGIFDYFKRRRRPEEGSPPPSSFLPVSPDFVDALLDVDSRDGYARERAVRKLAERTGGAELGPLLIRMNDWVPQVHDAARDAVFERIRPDYAAHFAANLDGVARLLEQKRHDHRDVVDAIFALLGSPTSFSLLWPRIDSPQRAARRLAFDLLFRSAGHDERAIEEALHSGLSARDSYLRYRAARLGREKLAGDALARHLARIRRDPFMPVRREALYGYLERLSDRAEAELTDALLDPHLSIQELARFHLSRSRGMDFADFYRRRMNSESGPRLAAAVQGIGSTGNEADAVRAEEIYRANRDVRVSDAAVRAALRLGLHPNRRLLASALSDRHARVRRTTARYLRNRPDLASPELLWEVFSSSPLTEVQLDVLPLMANLRWWDASALLLRARESATSNAELLKRIERLLDLSMSNPNRFVGKPSADQVERLRGVLKGQSNRWVNDLLIGLRQWSLGPEK